MPAVEIGLCRTLSLVVFRTAWNVLGTIDMTRRKLAARS